MYSCQRQTWLSSSNYFKWKRYLLAKQLNTYPICMLRPPIHPVHPSIRAMKYSLLPCWAINLSISPLSYCVWLWFPSIIRTVPPLRQFQTVRGRRQPLIDLTTFIRSHCSILLQRTFTWSKSDSSCLVWIRSSRWAFPNKWRACGTSELCYILCKQGVLGLTWLLSSPPYWAPFTPLASVVFN